MKENSKEEIRERMLRRAAALWDTPAKEIDMSFDPIVSMLLSVCASEIEKISGEIDHSQTRITEKLIQLMTPESVYGPNPAHAILFAKPIDNRHEITREYQFSYKKETVHKNTSVQWTDILFSPVTNFGLINADVKYLVCGNRFGSVDKGPSVSTMYQDTKGNTFGNSTLYIGISGLKSPESLEGISVYFDLNDLSARELFYNNLRNTNWYVGDQILETVDGFIQDDQSNNKEISQIFGDKSNKTINLERLLINHYSKNYITIKSVPGVKDMKQSNFRELDHIIETNKLKVDKDIYWLKIEFPGIISNDVLKSVFCSLNAFPVLNRKLNSFTYRLKEFVHILPINTDDLFLDVNSIETTEGKKYRAKSKDKLDDEKGTYMLRTDSVGKLDHRKARDYIVHLIELLKDESASFSVLDNDFLNTSLVKLNQTISILEQKVSDSESTISQTIFALLQPYEPEETLLVEFWSTNGALGNKIKSGSSLEVHKGIGIGRDGGLLLTTSHGGKDDLSMDDRLNSYRRSLLSRDRVVTKEDVRALCFELYGNKIRDIEIRKGYVNDLAINKGMIQCIQIEVHPNKQVHTNPEEWESINSNVLHYLEKSSINVFPFKIIILN